MAAPADFDTAQLRAGLAAIKRGDYAGAIAHLRQVKAGQRHEQAQMALVVSLEKTGDGAAAIAHCQPLLQSAKPETRQWAERSLTTLQKRFPAGRTTLANTGPAPGLKQAPAPPRWQPLSPVPPSRWTWAGLALLLIWACLSFQGAIAGPSFLLAYRGWVTGAIAALLLGLGWLTHRRLARDWEPLGLRLQEALTVIGVAWFVPYSVGMLLDWLNGILVKLPLAKPWVPPSHDWLAWLGIVALLPLLGLPWAAGGLVRLHHAWTVLSPESLVSISPKTQDLWQQLRRRHGVAPPRLLKLDSPVPFIVSYGHRPRNLSILLSQGLLDRLNAEEIAALMAGELGHLHNQATVVLPWLVVLLQLPFSLYWWLSRLGDYCQAKLQTPLDVGFRFLFRAGLISGGGLGAIAYGAFKLWRWPLLWLARSRTRAGDRAAADCLADPNAYSRALLAYGQALAAAITAEQQTPAMVEAWELLLPVGLPEALSLNLAATAFPLEERLLGDAASPYRSWLSLNNAHPPLGDRLALLGHWARQQGAPAEVDLPLTATALLNPGAALMANTWEKRRLALGRSFAAWGPLLYQGFPFFGLLLGLALGYGLWALGATASVLGHWRFDWLWGDRRLIWGCIPLGIGLGLTLRTNRFFPQRVQHQADLEGALRSLQPITTLPLDAEPVILPGQLGGRPGVANWLGQDLLLLTQQGPLRLHWCSPLGPAGNLWPGFLRPNRLVGQEVVVSGWLRRGTTLWLDVEQIKTMGGGRSSQRGHPLWAAVMVGLLFLWAWVIFLSPG